MLFGISCTRRDTTLIFLLIARLCPPWLTTDERLTSRAFFYGSVRRILSHLWHGNATPRSVTRDFLAALFSFAAATRHLSKSSTAARQSLCHAVRLVLCASQLLVFSLQIVRLCFKLSLYRGRGRLVRREYPFSSP